MHHLFGYAYPYDRFGLALLVGSAWACTSPPARSTRRRSRAGRPPPPRRCGCAAAALFVGWMLLGAVTNQMLRTEVGYAGAAGLLALALFALYRRGSPTASASAT